MPRFSVILISHQQRDLVEKAVRSVQAQSDPSWEIIAVDDGSTDGSLEALRALAAADSRIQVIAAPHSGLPSVTRNVGLARASGDVVSFLDGDDIYLPDRFARVGRAFAAFPQADVCFGDYRPFGLPKWDAIPVGMLAQNGFADRYVALASSTVDGCYCIASETLLPVLICEFFGAFTLNVSVRRRLIQARGLAFDPSLLMAEDHDFVVRALTGGHCVFVRDVLGWWLRHAQSVSLYPSARGARDGYRTFARHVASLNHADLPVAVQTRVRTRLAESSFSWGYAATRLGDFRDARTAFRASFSHEPRVRTLFAWLKALFHLADGRFVAGTMSVR